MNLEHYLPHLPEIERRLSELKPHALVTGLGPSAHLLPLIDKGLLRDVRIFGCNDAERYFKVNDLVLMDGPCHELHPSTERYQGIVKANPDRWWIYKCAWESAYKANQMCWQGWKHILTPEQVARVGVFDLRLLNKELDDHGKFRPPLLTDALPNHIHSTPTGATSIAWREGCRRIGLLGVDMIPGQKAICDRWFEIRRFFKFVATQAKELFGEIRQLSPFAMVQWGDDKPVPIIQPKVSA